MRKSILQQTTVYISHTNNGDLYDKLFAWACATLKVPVHRICHFHTSHSWSRQSAMQCLMVALRCPLTICIKLNSDNFCPVAQHGSPLENFHSYYKFSSEALHQTTLICMKLPELNFIQIRSWLVMLCLQTHNAARMHCMASYIEDEWKAWKQRSPWDHYAFK